MRATINHFFCLIFLQGLVVLLAYWWPTKPWKKETCKEGAVTSAWLHRILTVLLPSSAKNSWQNETVDPVDIYEHQSYWHVGIINLHFHWCLGGCFNRSSDRFIDQWRFQNQAKEACLMLGCSKIWDGIDATDARCTSHSLGFKNTFQNKYLLSSEPISSILKTPHPPQMSFGDSLPMISGFHPIRILLAGVNVFSLSKNPSS